MISLSSQTPFRSNLEASWAHTLDHLRIAWEYEPRVVTLQDGRRYLPDFWLPELTTVLEVKGAFVGRIDKTLMYAQQMLGQRLVVVGWNYRRPGPSLYRMSFSGAVERAGFARCIRCDAWGWVRREPMTCRACGAIVSRDSFYLQDAAPFWPGGRIGDRDGCDE